MPDTAAHPARFSDSIIDRLRDLVDLRFGSRIEPIRILDNFAGTGRIHEINNSWKHTVGVELEFEWASHNKQTIVGNALHLPFHDCTFECAVTSCTYGNRMADHHAAKDLCGACQGVGYENADLTAVCRRCKGTGLSVRRTYKHMLGRDLHTENSGQLHWHNGPGGDGYRGFHIAAWTELHRVLQPGAPFFLNVSDHIRGGERQRVASWHVQTLLNLGFDLLGCEPVQTPRMKFGSNHESRVNHELIVTLVKA